MAAHRMRLQTGMVYSRITPTSSAEGTVCFVVVAHTRTHSHRPGRTHSHSLTFDSHTFVEDTYKPPGRIALAVETCLKTDHLALDLQDDCSA